MGSVQSCGLHEALVISGGCWSGGEVRVLVGDWAWRWWWCSKVQRLELGIITLGMWSVLTPATSHCPPVRAQVPGGPHQSGGPHVRHCCRPAQGDEGAGLPQGGRPAAPRQDPGGDKDNAPPHSGGSSQVCDHLVSPGRNIQSALSCLGS